MAKLDTYARLSAKYMDDAESLIQKKEVVQAGEKLWGAAAKRGRTLKTHADLWAFVLSRHAEKPELELRRLFAVADHLHSNFYEDELPFEAVKGFAEAIRELIVKLEAL